MVSMLFSSSHHSTWYCFCPWSLSNLVLGNFFFNNCKTNKAKKEREKQKRKRKKKKENQRNLQGEMVDNKTANKTKLKKRK
jgi:hypothetical protein